MIALKDYEIFSFFNDYYKKILIFNAIFSNYKGYR